MSARDLLEILAWTTCSATAIFVIMCLSPGITEIRDKLRGVQRRARRKRSKGARHRLAKAPSQTDPDPGHRVQDPSSTEVAA
jgi:hypothetical protein